MKQRNHRQTAHGERNKIFALIAVAIILIGVSFWAFRYYQATLLSFEGKIAPNERTEVTDNNNEAETQIPISLPDAKDLVPYAAQAPFGNWTVHEESCEEAALYMYRGLLEGTIYPNNRIPDAESDPVFRAMKAWQVNKYGKEPDLTMTALGAFASSYYGYVPTVKKGIVEADIKAAIVAGHPVIVPVMTHSLGNTMYGPQTTYHVLLIKGYDSTGVITNDAGVGNGPGHHYDWNILWQAIDAQTAEMGVGREMLYLTK